MLKLKLPFLLLCIIIAVALLGNFLPLVMKQFFYAFSLTIKNILLTILPFLIIIFISSSLILLEGRVVQFVLMMILIIVLSNYIAVLFSYAFAKLTFGFLISHKSAIVEIPEGGLTPLWDFPRIKIIRNELGIILGFLLGLFFSIYRKKHIHDLFQRLQGYANTFLRSVFIPLLPFFIAGFLIKLEHDQVLNKVIYSYGPIFILFVLSQLAYVILLLIVVSKAKISEMVRLIKNTMPATITGFSTLSSAATMPVTIVSAEKNCHNHNLSKMVIPATVNIHLVGTSIGMNILILGTILTFTNELPTFAEYSYFGIYFALMQFSTVAVPGGVIFAMIPLLENQLAFSPEMVGIVSTLVMLFDPVDTSFNVTINALFAIVFANAYKKLGKLK